MNSRFWRMAQRKHTYTYVHMYVRTTYKWQNRGSFIPLSTSSSWVGGTCWWPANQVLHTVRDTENLPFSADTPHRFSEGNTWTTMRQYADRQRGITQIVCAAILGRSADLYNAEEVLEWTRKRTHSIEDGYWLAVTLPLRGPLHWSAILSFVQVDVSRFRSFDAAYEGSVLRVYVKALYSYVHTYLLGFVFRTNPRGIPGSIDSSARNLAENPSASAWISVSACTGKSRNSSEKCKLSVSSTVTPHSTSD